MDYTHDLELIIGHLNQIEINSYFHSSQLESIQNQIIHLENEIINIRYVNIMICSAIMLYIIYYFIMRCLK